jgi:Ca-activated chloride channel family protein
VTTDQALTQQLNPQVMNIVEKVTAFKLQTRALDDIEAGNVVGATQKLQGAVTRLLNSGESELAQKCSKKHSICSRAASSHQKELKPSALARAKQYV